MQVTFWRWQSCVCMRACVSHSVCVAEVPNSSSVHPPTLAHSPLPLLAPAEGTQGQVSQYKQLLPSVQGRSKGEGPYVCAKRGTLPVSWKGQWHATAMHTLTHTVTTCRQHTHTQLTTHIYLHAPWPAKLHLYQTKLILSIDVRIYLYNT